VLKSRRIIGHCDLRASFPEAFLDAGVLGGMRGDWVAVDCGERGKRQPGFRDTVKSRVVWLNDSRFPPCSYEAGVRKGGRNLI
jgi:hypothetical protein